MMLDGQGESGPAVENGSDGETDGLFGALELHFGGCGVEMRDADLENGLGCVGCPTLQGW